MSIVADSLAEYSDKSFGVNPILEKYSHIPVRSKRTGRLFNIQKKSAHSTGGGSSVQYRTYPVLEGEPAFGNVITFRIQENFIIRNVFLKLKLKQLVKHSSASYVCYSPTHFMINQLEVLANNGATELERLYPEFQYLFFRATTPSVKQPALEASMGSYLSQNSRIEDNTNSDLEYWCEIYGLLKTCDIPLGKLKSELRLRFTLENLSKVVETDATDGQFSGGGIAGAELVCEFQEFSPMLYKQIADDNAVKHYRFLQADRVYLSVPQGSTQINEILTAFNGAYPFIMFYLTSVNPKADKLYSGFKPIKHFELTDSQGSNISYKTTISNTAVKYLYGLEHWMDKNDNNFLVEMDNLMYFSFTDDPGLDWKTGSCHGYYPFTSRERMIITFDEPTTEDLTITLLGFRYGLLQLSKGELTAIR